MTFLLATPALLVVFSIAIIIIAVMVEFENTKGATGVFSVGLFILLWHFRVDMWSWMSTNPLNTFLFIGGYILGGMIWSLIKWKSYINRSARHFKNLKEKFNKEIGKIGSNWNSWIRTLNDNSRQLNKAKFYTEDESEVIIKKITVSPADKKGVIVSWIAYWPMSLGATILNDPIRRFGQWIYGALAGTFQRMSNSSVKGLEVGMERFEDAEQKDRN